MTSVSSAPASPQNPILRDHSTTDRTEPVTPDPHHSEIPNRKFEINSLFQHAHAAVFAGELQRHDRAHIRFALHAHPTAMLTHDALHDH